MSEIEVYILDKSNNIKGEVIIERPNSYIKLLETIRKDLKIQYNILIFILDQNNNAIEIYNEEKYKLVEDILFIREIENDIFGQSLYEFNYNRLSETNQQILDEKYNCILCQVVIKNEKPYFCYKCQKIYHKKCLQRWDNTCKNQNKNLVCPNCRNELPIEEWNKKLNYEEERKGNANLIEKIREFELGYNMYKNINIIKDRKINELKYNEDNQNELMKIYKNYIKKTFQLLIDILYSLNSIHSAIYLKENEKIIKIINKNRLYIRDLDLSEISNVIDEELAKFQSYIIEKNTFENKINNNIVNEQQKNMNNNYKENLCQMLSNFTQFIENINSYDSDNNKNYNYVYIVPDEVLIKYFGMYNLDYSSINNIIKENGNINIKINLLNEYVNKKFKFDSENIPVISIPKLEKNNYIFDKKIIYYYNNLFLLDEKTIKLSILNINLFTKIECFIKDRYILLFREQEGITYIDIGKLDEQNKFRLELLVYTTKDSKYIKNYVGENDFSSFYKSSFIFKNNPNNKFSYFSPFFSKNNNIIGYGFKLTKKFNNYNNINYNPVLVNIIYLIIFFLSYDYNENKYYYLINDKWMKYFKDKYMYKRIESKIENNDKLLLTINKVLKNENSINKLIYIIISGMYELNNEFNKISLNIDNNDNNNNIEPDCESIKDFFEIYFYKNYYILNEEIFIRIFNFNESELNEMKKKNNYCKCY